MVYTQKHCTFLHSPLDSPSETHVGELGQCIIFGFLCWERPRDRSKEIPPLGSIAVVADSPQVVRQRPLPGYSLHKAK